MKNLAGNDVAIFLFRFDLRGDGIDFVVNEAIAADRYEDVDARLKTLADACGETLLRYKPLSVSTTMMDCNILAKRRIGGHAEQRIRESTSRRRKSRRYSKMPNGSPTCW